MTTDAPMIQLLDDPRFTIQVKALAGLLSLPLLKADMTANEGFLLYFDVRGALCLQDTVSRVSITASFGQPRIAYRLRDGLQKEMLLRAAGVKSVARPSIIDATAGLGQDALLLSAAGCQVTLIEQSPLLVALLEHALQSALSGGDELLRAAASRMSLLQGESCELLPVLPVADVICLDPMFPQRRKTASVGKNMAMLQQLLPSPSPTQQDQLLDCARRCARQRVVVKRPRLAPPLASHKPDWQVSGRSSRFDVYRPLPS